MSVTFVPGLREADKGGCSIALFNQVQVDSMPSSVRPDSYPYPATARHAIAPESSNKAEGRERLPQGKGN